MNSLRVAILLVGCTVAISANTARIVPSAAKQNTVTGIERTNDRYGKALLYIIGEMEGPVAKPYTSKLSDLVTRAMEADENGDENSFNNVFTQGLPILKALIAVLPDDPIKAGLQKTVAPNVELNSNLSNGGGFEQGIYFFEQFNSIMEKAIEDQKRKMSF